MPNGKGHLECHYCTHYYNPCDELDRPVLMEMNVYLKRLKAEIEDAAAYKKVEWNLLNFSDFLSAGGQEGESCKFHQSALPSNTQLNRICSDFAPNENYLRDNPILEVEGEQKRLYKVEERFGWFEVELRPGVLFGFSIYHPSDLSELKVFKEGVE